MKTILFPSSYFNVNKVDEDLQAEYDAAVNIGLYDIILFGYDQWFNNEKLVLTKNPEEKVQAVYRGWMMKPQLYRIFYDKLLEKNIELVTNPEEYELMHVFPNVYEFVKNDTARMQVYPLHSKINIEELKKVFQRFMVKDFVKSVKGTEFPKFFDQTVTQEDFDKWMEVFYKYRGDLLTGGICIKEFLNLKRYGDKTNEFRVFYINHEIATISRNSGQMNITAEPPKEMVEKYRNLPAKYYTIDFVELSDGTWKIVETGDGSVSGLSDNQDYEEYYRKVYYCFKPNTSI